MTDSDRIFLLSLAAITACGTDPSDPGGDAESTSDTTGSSTMTSTTVAPSTSSTTSSSGTTEASSEGPETTDTGSESTAVPDTSSSTTDETTSTTSESTSESSGTAGAVECAGPYASPLVVACCAFWEPYAQCFGYDLPAGYCDVYAGYVEAYGEDCEAAVTELWTCLSMLDCGDFGDVIPAECQDTGLEAHAACPEVIPLCSSGSGGGGMGQCEVEASDCLDGHTYAVACMAGMCTCTLDGAPVGSFPGDGDACEAPGFGDDVVENCDFPPGLF
jgi:hypothetical protein